MRRALLIFAIVLLIALGLYLGRNYIFKSAVPVTDTVATTEMQLTEEMVNTEAEQLLVPISSAQVFDYWVDQSDRTVYFVTENGSVNRVRPGGEAEEIFSSGISDVSAVSVSPEGVSALIESGTPTNKFFSIINPVTRTRQFLPIGAISASWSPDGKEVVFLKSSTLNIFNVVTAKSRPVGALNMIEVRLDWASKNEIYISPKATNGLMGTVLSYNLTKKTLRAITPELKSLTTKWFGTNGLVFSDSANQNSLQLLNGQTEELQTMPVLTLPEKCFIDKELAYCGVSTVFANAKLPDQYYRNELNLADSIVAIELSNSRETLLLNRIALDVQIDVYHPIKVGSALYFINRNNNKIYSFAL